jgi:hypothetical protein
VAGGEYYQRQRSNSAVSVETIEQVLAIVTPTARVTT